MCFAAAAVSIGCGSSATTSTAPSTTAKCAVTTSANPSTLPAGGGTGSITVGTERECGWTARVDGAWLKITAGESGQGAGSIGFTATANADPSPRAAAIVVNDQRVELSQAAAACELSLSDASASMPAEGGSGRVDVRASSGQCPWTAASDVNWIAIASGASGSGSGPVTFTVSPSTSGARSGALKIAGQTFTVSQSDGCGFSIAPAAYASGAGGGSTSVAVTTGGGCAWQAASAASWIAVTPASGTGNAAVSVSVSATSGPARTGTATIAGRTFTVTQSGGCAVTLSPGSAAVAAAGGSATIAVTAASGCAWTAASNAGWIAIASGASGSGAGTVQLAVSANPSGARAGTVTIGGQILTVNQAGASCGYSLAPASQAVPPAGGSGAFVLTTGEGCAWSATANADWIAVTPAAGAGTSTLQFTASANGGPARRGTISVAGQTFTIDQDAARPSCTFELKPASADMGKDGGKGDVSVRAADGCAWTAQSMAPWITVTNGGSGSGNGTVKFDVDKNPPHGDARTGTIVIGTETFTVTQKKG